MNILYVDYTLKYKSLDIYLAGCKGDNGVHCVGCHNPESWNFNLGETYDTNYFLKIKEKVNDFDKMIDNIMIFGGEPLDNPPNELSELLFELNTLNKTIWLFTRYEIEYVPDYVKFYCKYIKTGKYVPALKCEDNIQFGIKLATSNQKIVKTTK